MRKSLVSSWLGVVVVAAGLGVVPALAAPVAATASPLPGDRDGDGVADSADRCPDTFGSPDAADGFAGCVRVGQAVYQVISGGGRVSGQVVPQSTWRGQEVCRAGIQATLQALWYTDHDPATAAGGLTEQTTSDANGFFAFDAELPFGTEFSVRLTPRAIVGGEAFCATASTSVYRHVEVVAREVVASYKRLTGTVTGRVVVPSGTIVEEACSDQQIATLLRRFDDRPSVAIASTTFRGADETFSIDVGQLASGTGYYVEIAERGPEGFPDLCRETRSDLAVIADQDDDGVPDAVDACKPVPGPVNGDVPGCVLVDRTLSATYDAGRVSGDLAVVSYPPFAGNPCQHPMVIDVWTVDAQGVRALAASGPSSGGMDQTYDLAVGSLPAGTRYVATTRQVLQPGIVLCGAAESNVRVSDDRDGDGVPDASDACRNVVGAAPTGCPTVARAVSASYGAGRLTGKVSVASLAGAPAGACSAAARVQAWQLGSGATRAPLGQPTSTLADGSYSIQVALAPGTTVLVSALAGDDPGRALCGAADSAQVVAFGDRDSDTVADSDDRCPDVPAPGGGASGCPVVSRALTASYAAGTVSGTVRPVNPAVAPAGACTGAPVAVSWTATDGHLVGRIGTVRPDGSYGVEIERPPVGTTLTVSLVAFDHDGVAACPAVQPATSVTVVSDRDDDGVPDTSDQCPDAEGPARVLYSGCRLLDRVLTTSYADGVLSGTVALVDPQGAPDGACSQPSLVEVVSLEGGNWADDLGSRWTEGDGTFAVPVGRLVDGTAYFLWAEGHLDPSAGFCRTADAQRVFLDADRDTFGDDEDRCPDVAGPAVGAPRFSEAFRGCRLVDVSVTGSYADRVVSGRLSVAGPADAPAGACRAAAQVRVTEVDGESSEGPDGREVGRGQTSAEDGTYSVDVGALPGGTRLRVTTYFPQLVVDGISACGSSRSDVVAVPDADGDLVADDEDECPEVQGPLLAERPGCPTLPRAVTAGYADGLVTGQVTVTNSGAAPASACLATAVELYRLGAGSGPDLLVGTAQSDAAGRFTLAIDAPTSYYVLAPARFDAGVALCASARSDTLQAALPDFDGDGVPDRDDACVTVRGSTGGARPGCPTLSRSVTASYAGSAVSGKVVVTNPGDAPAGACATATVEVYRLGAGGAETLVGSRATAADGTYVVSGVTLPPGAQYLARALGSFDTARASCAAASSVTQTVPAAPVDRDGDGVPDATDLCPTVPGSVGAPTPAARRCRAR